jgi:co-chaperonin GroES (HSP10)
MSKCEPAKCKRCGGSGTAPVDTRTDLEGVSASGICLACNGTGELSEVKPKAKVKFIGRDSAYEGKYNYLKDCLVNDEIAQLENISARLKKDGHKYLVIDTTGGEFIWTVK